MRSLRISITLGAFCLLASAQLTDVKMNGANGGEQVRRRLRRVPTPIKHIQWARRATMYVSKILFSQAPHRRSSGVCNRHGLRLGTVSPNLDIALTIS